MGTKRAVTTGFGRYETVLKRIFNYASACEGGMLKGANGRDIKPESYIERWMKKFKNQTEIEDRMIEISCGGNCNYAIPVNPSLTRFKQYL